MWFVYGTGEMTTALTLIWSQAASATGFTAPILSDIFTVQMPFCHPPRLIHFIKASVCFQLYVLYTTRTESSWHQLFSVKTRPFNRLNLYASMYLTET